MPGIRTEGLLGAIVYHDAQFDDARLAINLVQTIIEKGGLAINYMKVSGLLKNSNDKLYAVTVADIESGIAYTIKSKVIINATGVFVDDILQMDNRGIAKSICVSQGAHIVLDKSFFPLSTALMIPKTSDGRILFAIPWHEKVIVGTTDTPIDEVALEPRALQNEIDFILETAGKYFVKKPSRPDVLSVFAGLRPLAAPKRSRQKTKEISRGHKMIVSASGLFTILGGKWTTYRKMGEDMLDFVEKKMKWIMRKSVTSSLAIHGSGHILNGEDPFYFYGSDALYLKPKIENDVNEWLSKKLNIHKAQVVWAVEHEMARTLEDVLARRTRALFLDADEAIHIAPAVASIMKDVLHNDENWKSEQIENFRQLAFNYLLK
jgi:glycerol-3-phosphate dehydrogenase